jgi:hypothetical protein
MEIKWEGMKWIHLTQDRERVGSETSGSVKGGKFLD